MNPPTKVPYAAWSPGHCFICGGHEGPMVDTHVDFGEYRHYICMRLCAPIIAQLVSPDNLPAGLLSEKCSKTKKDGTPCTAYALPGRDVCVAHSKPAKVEV